MSSQFEVIKSAIGTGELYRDKFQYRIEHRPRSIKNPGNAMAGEELVEWLNDCGGHGWALCAVREDEYGWSEFIFRRSLT